MGVTITYSGRIENIERIPELVAEFKDICEVMNWKYNIFDDSHDEPASLSHDFKDGSVVVTGNAGLRGISFAPHEKSEAIYLAFLRDGQASNISLALFPNEGNWIFTKTQFAGIDTHIRAVDLLEYVAAKYFSEFHIEDDCQYVEHRDRDRSAQTFDIIDDGIDMISEAIESIDTAELGNDNDLFKAIEDRIKLFMKGRK